MKKKTVQKKTKKLVLSRETVHELNAADLEKPAAGAYALDRTITISGYEESAGC